MKNSRKTKIRRMLSGNRVTRLTVLVADTQEKIEKGFMFIENLAENEGMLFVFPGKIYRGFWMKHTLIPLSIAFLDSEGEILEILDMAPCKGDPCPIYFPKYFYRYAIEVNLGWFEKNRIREGDYVKLD